MIKYALVCEHEHPFEGWFGSSADYEDQQASGLVECPTCASHAVRKQIMAPAVARTDLDRAPAPADETAAGVPAVVEAPAPMVMMTERERAFRALLRAVREHVEATAENVGPRFADEARKMHEGLSAFRAIYGEATPEEARALAEDGIEALPLPILPDDRN